VVPESFHSFFEGSADVAGALIGLLFVALSVSPVGLVGEDARVERQVSAGAAFSALVNTLVISLAGLLPGANLGDVGLALAAAGMVTTIGLIVVLYGERASKVRRREVRMLGLLILLYALQLANAIQLQGSAHPVPGISRQGGLCILFFVFGIARSWQLAGERDLRLGTAVATAMHRPARQDQAPAGPPREGEESDDGA
jgi:hypothetical protein